ncbi:MAG: hypothetical protein F6K46_12590 [Moorea sp. SIO3E8]|nr:hypothetical protein [Moorena sp. SIO3E8]
MFKKTIALSQVRLWLVRYGAGCPRQQIEHQTKPAPNTPYATSPRFPIPDSRFPIPCSRFPIPDS